MGLQSMIYSGAMKRAHEQYNDAVGTVAIDWHDGGQLHRLAEAVGIDLKRHFPIGMSLNHVDGALKISQIYYVDASLLPEYSFEAVKAHLLHNPDGYLESGPLDLTDDFQLRHHVKRLSIEAFAKGFEEVL